MEVDLPFYPSLFVFCPCEGWIKCFPTFVSGFFVDETICLCDIGIEERIVLQLCLRKRETVRRELRSTNEACLLGIRLEALSGVRRESGGNRVRSCGHFESNTRKDKPADRVTRRADKSSKSQPQEYLRASRAWSEPLIQRQRREKKLFWLFVPPPAIDGDMPRPMHALHPPLGWPRRAEESDKRRASNQCRRAWHAIVKVKPSVGHEEGIGTASDHSHCTKIGGRISVVPSSMATST